MSHHLGQVQSVKDYYDTAQTDTVLVSCPNGRRLYIWNIIVSTGSGSDTTVEFGSSPRQEICSVPESCSMGMSSADRLGGQNEDILISCPANTTVRIQYTLE